MAPPAEETEAASIALLALAGATRDVCTEHQERRTLQLLHTATKHDASLTSSTNDKTSLQSAQPAAAQPAMPATPTMVHNFWHLSTTSVGHGIVFYPVAAVPHVAVAAAPTPARQQGAPASGTKRRADGPAVAASGAKRCRWKGAPKVLQKQGMVLTADGSARFAMAPVVTPRKPSSAAATRCKWKPQQVLQKPGRPAGSESPRSVIG